MALAGLVVDIGMSEEARSIISEIFSEVHVYVSGN